MVLLAPNIDTTGRRKLGALAQWRTSIGAFSLSRLQGDVPHEGIFAKPTPACFAPLPPVATTASRPSHSTPNSMGSLSSGNSSARHPTSRADRASRQRASPPATSSSGESLPSQKARGPLLMIRTPDFVKSLGEVVHDINVNLPPASQLKVPTFRTRDSPRPMMLCFRFATSAGPGCTRPGNSCAFAHIDMSDRARARDNVPSEFYRNLMSLLEHREVARSYGPTAAFTAFLGRR
jgi:hypothetical protein